MNVVPAQYPRLKQLWGAGLSAIECGAELGLDGDQAAVREAVLRAVEDMAKPTVRPKDRRGGRPDRSNLPARYRTRSADTDPMFAIDGVDGKPAPADLEIPIEQRKGLLELTAAVCNWPVGEPKEPGFFFCGAPAHGEESYCAHHCRRAYNGHLSRRRAA